MMNGQIVRISVILREEWFVIIIWQIAPIHHDTAKHFTLSEVMQQLPRIASEV